MKKEIQEIQEIKKKELAQDKKEAEKKGYKPIPYGLRVAEEVVLYVEVLDEGFSERVRCKFEGDEKIIFHTADGEKHTRYIIAPPKVHEEEKKGFLWKSRQRSLMFYTSRLAECTHDPVKSALDIPTIQMAQKLSISMIENDLLEGLSKVAEGRKQWREYIPYLFMFLEFVIGMVLMSGILENLG